MRKMKNIFGLLICAIGGYIMKFGYSMLTPETQKEYDERLRKAFQEL